ncbi:hypothetical protein Pcinc_043927 [Petrolisthes cinctipes]|uniref:Uncharacterized protein n=1 Tax=Petrolisthes cinctipes TaxID=88211 RepID=A0AAE1EEV1_PETCI|nr:hypothetical protein Pcinc_043927 [Petrolisthes cinctipes]
MSSGGPGWRGWGPGISALGPGRGWLGTSLRAKTTTWLAGRRLAGGSGRCAKGTPRDDHITTSSSVTTCRPAQPPITPPSHVVP